MRKASASLIIAAVIAVALVGLFLTSNIDLPSAGLAWKIKLPQPPTGSPTPPPGSPTPPTPPPPGQPTAPAAPPLESVANGNCADGLDNDGNGGIDCGDAGCMFDPQANCPNRETGHSGFIPHGASTATLWLGDPTLCYNGKDDDKDGLTDCADPDCAWHCDEGSVILVNTCFDTSDNDRDGLTDCADPDCALTHCLENYAGGCTDGFDNDNNGLKDCQDPACMVHPNCAEPSATILSPKTGTMVTSPGGCFNGIDDDGDGVADCADPDCVNAGVCTETGHCDDNVDNDLDRLSDCSDVKAIGSNCRGDQACAVVDSDYTPSSQGNNFQVPGSITLGGPLGKPRIRHDMCVPSLKTPKILLLREVHAASLGGGTALSNVYSTTDANIVDCRALGFKGCINSRCV